ncbi:MAG: Gfo/Idh/MocA family protein, partial [Candidatus Dormibacteria bacterium]
MSRDRLRWGILGTAAISRKALIPAIRGAGGEVVAVASREGRRAQEFAASCAVPLWFEGYEGLLAADLDAVYIPLPNSLHRHWTLEALAAAKHVLCEKPLALTAAEAEAMRERASERGLVLAEALMYRYHPRWALVRELIGSGRLGQIRHIQGVFTFPLAVGENIRWQPSLGGGALYDVGCYLIDACRWLLGEPESVLATAKVERGIDTEAAMLLRFPSSAGVATAELACGFGSAECQQLLLLGSEGSLLVPRAFTAWSGEAVPLLLRDRSGSDRETIATPEA